MTKYIYEFGPNRTDGDASQKNLLGGKGANLAEMAKLGLPVPPGFTISTECCNHYFDLKGRFPDTLEKELKRMIMGFRQQYLSDLSFDLILSTESRISSLKAALFWSMPILAWCSASSCCNITPTRFHAPCRRKPLARVTTGRRLCG